MFKTILVATDGSGHAHKAIELAGDLAEKYAAELIVLHVMKHGRESEELRHLAEIEHLVESAHPAERRQDMPRLPAEMIQYFGDSQRETNARTAFAAVARMLVEEGERTARAKGVGKVRTLIESGDPAHEIVACAKRENADLIVLGSRGLGDLKGLLTGSVSHKVGQLAECTCVTVK